MLWVCIAKEREEKCLWVMGGFATGWKERVTLTTAEPPYGADEVAVWGQIYIAERVIPWALSAGLPFWQVDNGYWLPAKAGARTGYHRVCYRGLSPILLKDAPLPRADELRPSFDPWRKSGKHILIALPGQGFGRSIGLDMGNWIAGAYSMVRKYTDRPIVVRTKDSKRPLALDLADCWALVTHSSNVAVEAVLAGIPVFVASTSPAAPVGSKFVQFIEQPLMPDRLQWWSSLMAQQFTRAEMVSGLAYEYLQAVRSQRDGFTRGLQNFDREIR